MFSRLILKFIIANVIAVASLGIATTAERQNNILWIYLEDVSGWFSCYGDSLIKTPNIDSLASEGIRFDRFYTPAGVCSATRSAIITGMMQTTIGAHHHRSCRATFRGKEMGEYDKNVLPEEVVPLPILFKRNGYYTFNEGTGKDDFNFEWDPNQFYDHRGKRWNFKGATNGSEWTGRKKNQPFFGQIQISGGKSGKRVKKVISPSEVPIPPYYPDIALVRKEIAHHYDCLMETDNEVGKIIAALKRDDLYDNTLIFLFSDHGYKLHRHKQYLYEGGIRMPLIVSGPCVQKGNRKDLVSGIDISAASLVAAGISIPAKMEGRDFLSEAYKPREYVIAARDRCDYTYERIRAVVTGRYKYLKNYLTDRPYMNPSYKDPWPVSKAFRKMMKEGKMNQNQLVFFGDKKPPEELYDLENDPHELVNLANDPKHKMALSRHRDILSDWIKLTGDKGQVVESDIGLLATMKRWGNLCVNPEYDRVRDRYKKWKASQQSPSKAKKKVSFK
ncbi:sulfatase [Verrucomicrobiales bacterium]|nr:sulfatase [Verrucomicrobiales bacterium]